MTRSGDLLLDSYKQNISTSPANHAKRVLSAGTEWRKHAGQLLERIRERVLLLERVRERILLLERVREWILLLERVLLERVLL